MTEQDGDTQSIKTLFEMYGNGKSIEDVYENPHRPSVGELIQALGNTSFLSEEEATAFAYGQLGAAGGPVRYIEDYPQRMGFEDQEELDTKCKNAQEKIADALWINELLSAYRYPDFESGPSECEGCGTEISQEYVRDETGEETQVLCFDCADYDPNYWWEDSEE